MGWDDPVGRLSDPTADEFRKWVSWSRVHEFFGVPGLSYAVVEKLLRRLTAGTLFAGAEIASWLSDGVRKTRGRTSVDPSWWASISATALTDAIEAGDIVISVPDRETGAVSTINLENMRFEWSGIYDALPGLQAKLHPMTAGTAQRPPPIPTRSIASLPAAPAPTPPSSDIDPDDASPEEFARWLTPAETLAALKELGQQAAVDEVLRRAKVGRVRAAGSANWRSDGEDRSEECAVIPNGWWERGEGLLHPHEHFWKTGGITFHVRTRGIRDPTVPIHYFGVKFQPKGIFGILGREPPPTEEARRADNQASWAKLAEAVMPALESAVAKMKPEMDKVSASPLPPHEDGLAPKGIARRNGQRKAIGDLPFAPDDKLTIWYEQYHAKRPSDVYRVIKPLA